MISDTPYIQPKNLSQQVVNLIGRRIISGHYQVGEKLPVENQLCAEFGVSRPIMREATKVLMAKGLVVSKPKVGTTVKPKSAWNLLDPDVIEWTIQSLPERDFLDMLFDVRIAIEPEASAMAAKNATPEDRRAIADALAGMKTAKNAAEMLKPDLCFHQSVMDATHNDLMRYIGNALHAALAASISLTSRHPDTMALTIPRHEAVYEAIAEGDQEKARECSKILLLESRQDFEDL